MTQTRASATVDTGQTPPAPYDADMPVAHRWVLGVVVALVATLLGAAPADAHAQLISTSPIDGDVLPVSPAEVVLQFNEQIQAPVGAVRVYDTAGDRIDDGSARADGVALIAPLPPDLDGSYVVAWRVVSADGHPVTGAFVFHVGALSGAVDDALIADLLTVEPPVAWPGELVRWASYLAVLAVIGLVVFGWLDDAEHVVAPLLGWVATVGALVSLLQIPIQAMEATGLGPAALVQGAAWTDAMTSGVGLGAIARALACVVVAVGIDRGPAWGLAGSAGIVVAELLVGHTRTLRPRLLMLGADAVHVIGAGVWFGGLIGLVLVLRHRRDRDDLAGAARSLATFSSLATWTVVALGVAGIALAWVAVRLPEDLVATTYGWALLVKTGIVAAVLGVAVYNNRVVVPHLVADPDGDGWQRLRTTLRLELFGLVAAIGITAMLVTLPPPVALADEPFSTYLPFGDNEINLVIDPASPGFNGVHLYVLTPLGTPALVPGEMQIEFSLPSEEVGPIVRRPDFVGPGHFVHIGSELGMPGTWEVTIRHRISDFEELTETVTVRIRR